MRVERGVAVPRVWAGVAVGIGDRRAACDQLADARRRRHLLHAAREGLHAVGRFDADDVGAPLRQQLRDMRACPDDGDLGDADAVERQRQFVGKRALRRRRPRLGRENLVGVFVQERRAARFDPTAFGQFERTARVGQRAGLGVLDLVPRAASGVVRIGHDIGDRVEGAGKQSVRLRLFHDLPLRSLGEPGRVDALQFLALGRIDVERVDVLGVRRLDHPQEPRQAGDARAHDVDVAVGA